MTAFRARWLCWVVALLAALPLAGPGADRFFCRSMGVVFEARCCGARARERAAHAEVERRASVEAPSRCQRVKGASGDAAPALSLRDGGGPTALHEVDSVFGKVGRAETATDPAPLTMVETTVRLKPPDQWPRVERPHVTDPFGPPVPVPALDSPSQEGNATLSRRRSGDHLHLGARRHGEALPIRA